MQYVEQHLPTLPDHLKSPVVCSWVRVEKSLVFYFESCVLLFSLFVFFCFSHDGVSLSSIQEFECPIVIFRRSFQKQQTKMIYSIKRQPLTCRQGHGMWRISTCLVAPNTPLLQHIRTTRKQSKRLDTSNRDNARKQQYWTLCIEMVVLLFFINFY